MSLRFVTPVEELMVDPLTPDEKKYLLKLQRVLLKCPATIEFYTIGDNDLAVIRPSELEICDGQALDNGIYLCAIDCSVKIHGTTG